MTTSPSDPSPADPPPDHSTDSDHPRRSERAHPRSESPSTREEPSQTAERHRAFVRTITRRLSRMYAWGGMSLLTIVGGTLGGGWWFGVLTEPLLWLGALTVGLLLLIVLRHLVFRRARHLAERLEAYCRANDLSVETLRNYYGHRDRYPFFEALFDILERRGASLPSTNSGSNPSPKDDGGQD